MKFRPGPLGTCAVTWRCRAIATRNNPCGSVSITVPSTLAAPWPGAASSSPSPGRAHAPTVRRPAPTEGCVSTSGPVLVTATVCSKCADRLPSRVTAVQPSLSTRTAGFPMFTIGSIASTIPSASRGPCPGSP